jgi:hypothetical protein
MELVYQDSLALTVDAVNDALLFGQALSKSDRQHTAQWIVARHNLPGGYANMFAPTEKDFQTGLTLFTGEKISSRVGTSHILGQESRRVLNLLDIKTTEVKKAAEEADSGFLQYLRKYLKVREGMYCCTMCSCVFWRRLSAAPLENSEQILTNAVKTLKSFRDGKGRWHKFPFYYTLLVLSDINLPYVNQELSYAALAVESSLKKNVKKDKISQRRRALAERILEKY